MKEGMQNFDDTIPAEEISSEGLSGAKSAGELPVGVELHEGMSVEEYTKLSADLEAFYIAQVEAIESGEGTMADMEIVEFAQAIQESGRGASETSEPSAEIVTTAQATEYLRQPSIMEKLSGKVRKALVMALSATALAAAMPATANAQGGSWGSRAGVFTQTMQYGVQRGAQEAQIALQTRQQLEQLKMDCDQTIQSIENNIRFQIDSLQIQHNIDLHGIALLDQDAVQQFRERNQNPTQQQAAVFTQARQLALNADMQIRYTVLNCNTQMRRVSQGAEYQRTIRVTGDIGNVILMRR